MQASTGCGGVSVGSRRRHAIAGSTFLAAVAGLMACVSAAETPRAGRPRPPNVVVIFADDLGYADIGCFGADRILTPNLDRMAREGTRFTSFCVPQAVCTASRAGLLTGCYPNRVGMSGALNHTSQTGIHPSETLLSERLQARGYATAAYGKWHLGHHPPFWPTHRGFDDFFGIPYSNDNGPRHPVVRGLPPLPLYESERVVETDPDQSLFTRRITDKAVAFIDRNHDRPFFLYVPHVMPHVPIAASEAWRGKSGRGLYADVIGEIDWSVGEIIGAVAKAGIREQTLVVFTSDNGPFLSYGEHAGSAAPLREGKLTCFEGGVRVPCVMRWPGRIPAGRACDALLTTLDLCTTVAALCDAGPVAGKPVHASDGLDLSPLLFGEPGAVGRGSLWYYSGEELHAVREGDWKLHLPHEFLTVAGEPGRDGRPSSSAAVKPLQISESGIRGIASRHGYRVEQLPLSLFNLATDPGESRNLADLHPEVVARLMNVAEEARRELGDALTGAIGR